MMRMEKKPLREEGEQHRSSCPKFSLNSLWSGEGQLKLCGTHFDQRS